MKLDEVKHLGYAVAIPLPTDAELPKEIAATLAANPPINVLRMLAGSGDMFPAVLAMIKAVFYAADINPRLREIIVLRCAHLLNCPYEWQANIVMAPNAGVTADEIAAIGTNGPVENSDPAIRLICKATDEITQKATLADETLAGLIAAYGPRIASKYILAIGWFNLLSRFLNATRVPLEAESKLAGRTSPI
jgi:4-carboxymuconolactone decarboxylase